MIKDKNIVLIGFMGSGKSMVSKRLGVLLSREIFSTDKMIEEEEGRSVSSIFEESGEEYFRTKEKEAVGKVSKLKGVILDCGGGIVLDQANIDKLKENGYLIYLSATPEFIYEQVKHKKNRPLLDVDDPKAKIKELLELRKAQYAQADQTVISDGKTIEQICDHIMEILNDE